MTCKEGRFNTGNKLCSNDLRDLNDNSIIVDGYVNSDADYIEDRLGVERLTLAGIESINKKQMQEIQDHADSTIGEFDGKIDAIIKEAGGVEVVGEFGDSVEHVINQEKISEHLGENSDGYTIIKSAGEEFTFHGKGGGVALSSSVSNAFLKDKYFSAAIQDLTIAHNKQGTTLGAAKLIRHEHKEDAKNDTDKLLDALEAVPQNTVFCGLERWGSVYTNLIVRDVDPRYHIGKAKFSHGIREWEGADVHVATITGDWLSMLRTTYHFDAPLELSKQLENVGARYVRLATNATANSSTHDTLPSAVSNGVLFEGDDKGKYYWATCLLTAESKLVVKPHKGLTASSVVEEAYYNEGAVHSFSFKYPLMVDGEIFPLVEEGYTTEVGYSSKLSARTVIGQRQDGALIIAVVDGKTDESGLTVKSMAELLVSLGCVQGFNLDGGGSSEMIVTGNIVNTPSDGKERKLLNGIYLI